MSIAQTTASGGTLQLGDNGDSSALSYNTSISVGRIGTGITVPNAISFGGAIAGDYASGIINNQGANTFTGNMTLTSALQRVSVTGGSLTFAGPIAQAGGVTASLGKVGGNTLVLSGNNSYTGQTIITAGTLSVADIENGGVNSNIGASPAVATGAVPNLLLNGGTLLYTGTGSTTNRGYQLQANSTINVSAGSLAFGGQILSTGGSFTKVGTGPLTYTNVTGTNTYETATGSQNYVVNQGVVAFGTAGATASGQVNAFSGEVDGGATGQLSAAEIDFNSGTSTIGQYLTAARGNSTTGLTGTVNVNTDAVVKFGNFSGGYSNGLGGYNGVAIVNFNGTSTSTDAGIFRMGESAGGNTIVSVNGSATLNVGGGAGNGLQVGYQGNASFNQNGGTVVTANPVQVAVNATAAVGTYTLGNGTAGSGVLRTTGVAGGTGTSTLAFNGGTLQANASSATFVTGLTHAYVGAAPAVIDTNTFAVTVPQVLATNPTVTTDGGLSKIGVGTLILTGANTYAGGTTVNLGTLATGTAGSFGTGNVAVAAGAVLTLNNPLSIADSGVLSFADSSTVNLNASSGSSETVASLYNLTTQLAFATPGVYTAAQLDAQFNDGVFAGTETLTIVGAPEPASLLLAGLAAAPLVLGRRRRQSRSA